MRTPFGPGSALLTPLCLAAVLLAGSISSPAQAHDVCSRMEAMDHRLSRLIEMAKRGGTLRASDSARADCSQQFTALETRVRLLQSRLAETSTAAPDPPHRSSGEPAGGDLAERKTALADRYNRLIEITRQTSQHSEDRTADVSARQVEQVAALELKVRVIESLLAGSSTAGPLPVQADEIYSQLEAMGHRLSRLYETAKGGATLQETAIGRGKLLQQIASLETYIRLFESALAGTSPPALTPLPKPSGDLTKRLTALDDRYNRLMEIARQTSRQSEERAAAVSARHSQQVAAIEQKFRVIESLLGGSSAAGPFSVQADDVSSQLETMDHRVSRLVETAKSRETHQSADTARAECLQQMAALEAQVRLLESGLTGMSPATLKPLPPKPSGDLTERLAALDLRYDRLIEIARQAGRHAEGQATDASSKHSEQVAAIEEQIRVIESLLGGPYVTTSPPQKPVTPHQPPKPQN